ncbi:AraC family transcriptional regulator [Geomonas limicola]|uniref:DNA-3-methyladenine glycosylase II n=1 Tax=Geomonas limicola TaxID=2740186 RepID=A0A6V8N9P6_9BACT|nr:Ada metal-binding domain-containing protein [Geomonas limicola]GFO69261.1 AraC family transcriptional regulator [Geomonas limicola]
MDELFATALHQALTARDPRHDGRFYYGVTTTGIYCRPVCPARPKPEHVRFFKSKAEAERAGYRPCLRCRPDLSPSCSQWQGTAAVVARALTIMEREATESDSLGVLAERLGISDRHLRRLFREHLGASPIEVAISRRLHLARQLLSQTSLSVTDIALASGFNSLRRFNDAFTGTYQRTPSEFRKASPQQPGCPETITLHLPYLPPYDWNTLLRYYARHEVFGTDVVEDGWYLRQLGTPQGPSLVRVRHLPEKACLEVSLTLHSFSDLRPTVAAVRDAFDLDHNPLLIVPGSAEASVPALAALAGGIRIPGAFDPLEIAVSVILGQLVSTVQGRRNLQKLVERFGTPVPNPLHPRLTHRFPTAEILAREDLSVLGFTKVRAAAINELARAFLEGRLTLSRSCDLAATRQALARIRGIGPWTVEMIALRCLGDPDAFPATDLVLARALAASPFRPDELRPWRGYFALALWKAQTAGDAHDTTSPASGPERSLT